MAGIEATMVATEPVLVDREEEMRELLALLAQAAAGRGRMLLLAGEAGIGKTRLATEAANRARSQGFRVLWGRCHEAEGAPAYWPWVEILRACAHEDDAESLAAELADCAPDVGLVIPELPERFRGAVPSTPQPRSDQARFRFFDGLTTFLRRTAARQPLLLVLDDLHWADESSLLLLRFLAREMSDIQLLLVGTHRDGDAGAVTQRLTELAGEHGVRCLQLRGLSEQHVSQYVEHNARPFAIPPLVTAIHRKTEGNPFFVAEVVRLLAANGSSNPATMSSSGIRIPQTVRTLVRTRLARLSPDCMRLLETAAVLGREFGLDVVAGVAEVARPALMERVDEAVAARVIAEEPRALGRYAFAHAIVRETLYGDMSALRRAELHRRAGETLAALPQEVAERRLSEIAHHFFQAARGGGDVGRAIDWAQRAGDRSLDLLAYEEAARFYRMALQGLELETPQDADRRGALLLALAEAQRRAGDSKAASATFAQAAQHAREHGTAEQLARAALGVAQTEPATSRPEERYVALLADALAALGPADGALQARLLGRLAVAIYWSESPDDAPTISQRAVEMARRVHDPLALAHALDARHYALWGTPDVQERLDLATEILALAQEAGDQELTLVSRHWRVIDLLALGDARATLWEMAAHARLAEQLRQPRYVWYAALWRAMLALADGRFAEAELAAEDALHTGEGVHDVNAAAAYRAQLFMIRREQGRLGELEPAVVAAVRDILDQPGWRCGLALVYCEVGRHAEARGVFAEIMEEPLRRDIGWSTSLALLAEVCAFVGDAEHAASLYRLLEPYGGCSLVLGPGLVTSGSASRHLGLLATTMGRYDQAARHFEVALAANARMPVRPALARTQHDYAAMLIARGGPGDRRRALELLDAAVATARELGMTALLEQALRLETRARGIGSDESSVSAVVAAVQMAPPDLAAHAGPDGAVSLLFVALARPVVAGDAFEDAVHLESALVREHLAGTAGVEVANHADAFLLAFPTAAAALACATGMQRDAARDRLGIALRIGGHTVPIRGWNGGSFERGIVAAAQIVASARGGEILVSSLLRRLAATTTGVRFDAGRDVGLEGPWGMRRVFAVERAPEELGAGASTSPPPPPNALLRREGEYWTVAYAGSIVRLRDTRGLCYLAALLHDPGREFHCCDLIDLTVARGMPAAAAARDPGLPPPAGLGGAGAVLDAPAKCAYRERLADLRAEVAEAEAMNDLGRVERTRAEMEFIARELAAAVGLGGRDRQAASAAERARVAVTKGIKRAITLIHASHPGLGEHLTLHVRTGTFCVYLPDPEHPVAWG
jgi:tetratricopeptide (TPR) repeat protein